MELRIYLLCSAVMVLVVAARSSVNGYVEDKRESNEEYGDFLGDEPNDDDTLNDADGEADEGNTENIVIVTNQKIYNVSVGDSLTLDCETSPPGIAVLQWLHNDNIYYLGTIKTVSDTRLNLSKNGSMTISKVTPSDEGEYKCVVTQNKPLTLRHRVVVISEPIIRELTATNNGVVVEGSQLVLSCDVTATPPPQIVWSRQRQGFNENERLRESDGIFNLNSVTIEHAKPEHSGKYYCYAFNGVGNAQAEKEVTVLYKPRVHVHRSAINTAPGARAELQCSAHGDPTPYLTWYKDGSSIAEDPRYVIINNGSQSTLVVVPKADNDFGTYTCIATNSHGVHNKSVELVQRPVIEEVEADGLKLVWKVHSHQPLEDIRIQAFPLNGDNADPTNITVPLPVTRGKVYEMSHEVNDLPAGQYEVIVKVKNNKEWSRNTSPVVLNIAEQSMLIQRSSVFRGAASSVAQSTTLLSTTLMYLLIRML